MRRNIVIIALYIFGMFIAVVPYILLDTFFNMEDPFEIVAFIVTYVSIALVLVYFIFIKLKDDFRPFINRFWKNVGIIGIVVVLSFTLSVVANIITQLIGITEEAVNQGGLIDMIKNATTGELIVLVLLFCLLVPIIEELVFRKALYGLIKEFIIKIRLNGTHDSDTEKIRKRLSISAVIISGLIFGLVHVSGDYIYLLHYGGAGIILTASYYLSKENIYVPLTVHIIQNAIGVVQILIAINLGLL